MLTAAIAERAMAAEYGVASYRLRPSASSRLAQLFLALPRKLNP